MVQKRFTLRQREWVGGGLVDLSSGRRRVRREVADIEHRPDQLGLSRESTLGHVGAGRASAESSAQGSHRASKRFMHRLASGPFDQKVFQNVRPLAGLQRTAATQTSYLPRRAFDRRFHTDDILLGATMRAAKISV